MHLAILSLKQCISLRWEAHHNWRGGWKKNLVDSRCYVKFSFFLWKEEKTVCRRILQSTSYNLGSFSMHLFNLHPTYYLFPWVMTASLLHGGEPLINNKIMCLVQKHNKKVLDNGQGSSPGFSNPETLHCNQTSIMSSETSTLWMVTKKEMVLPGKRRGL